MTGEWNPIREAFFKRTLENDFRTIYQRQLEIAESGTYHHGSGGKRESYRAQSIGNKSGTLRSHLASAPVRIDTSGQSLSLHTKYPIYIRFLDMKRKGNWAIYNRQIWGILYNETLPELKFGLTESIADEIRGQLEGLFPRGEGEHSKAKAYSGYGKMAMKKRWR